MSNSITSSQWNDFDVQVDSVARYFRTLDHDNVTNAIYKRIHKLNKTKKLSDMTVQQYHDTMQWLFELESVAHKWHLANCFIERELHKSLVKRKMDTKKDDFKRPPISPERLSRAQSLSKELVNLNVLTKLF
ncbi:MAG: hypothetical protein EKK64_10940 [Neisseriaceae bacterium]|nr:MAG: hypothetical protein EKK64_10940 [Neisseriaceae bacterium]